MLRCLTVWVYLKDPRTSTVYHVIDIFVHYMVPIINTPTKEHILAKKVLTLDLVTVH